MTDLIPRDAVISPEVMRVWTAANIHHADEAVFLDAVAAIREAALREAADYHESRADDELALSSRYRGGSNPWFEHTQRAKLHKECATAILALIGEKK